MAFIRKLGNIVKETTNKVPNLKSSIPYAPLYHAIRCFSSSKLFIGGLSYATDENSLKETFSPYGDVVEARIIIDRESGRSRGFGFVSYTSTEEASAAIQALDGRDLHGRFIKVAYATDSRRTNHGPSFAGTASYGARNYGDAGVGYNPYGNTRYGNTVHHSDGNYNNPNVGNNEGFSGDGNGNMGYVSPVNPNVGNHADGLNVGSGGGQYMHNAVDNFGNGRYGDTGSFGMNDYNTSYGGNDSSFSDRTPHNNASWQNHNVDMNEDGYANARHA